MSDDKSKWFTNFLLIGFTLLGIGFIIQWFFKFIFSIPIHIWFWIILLYVIVRYSK
jgi:hypothetical protein